MIRILGAPADIVDLSKASRVRAGDPGVDIIDGAIIPLIAPATFPRFEGEGAETYSGWKAAAYDRDGRVCSASLLDRSWTRVTIPFEAAEIERASVNFKGRQKLAERLAGRGFEGAGITAHVLEHEDKTGDACAQVPECIDHFPDCFCALRIARRVERRDGDRQVVTQRDASGRVGCRCLLPGHG